MPTEPMLPEDHLNEICKSFHVEDLLNVIHFFLTKKKKSVMVYGRGHQRVARGHQVARRERISRL